MESEAKWNNEASQRWSKDDQKEQSHLRDLERKFQSSDYSEKTGLSPTERLAAMNRDINAIVVEREHIAQEKEKADESAMSIQQSDAGRRADPSIGNDPSQASVKSYASEKGGDVSGSSVSSGAGQQASFPTGDIGKSASSGSSGSKARRELDMGRSGGDSSEAAGGSGGRSSFFGRDKLDDAEAIFQRPLTRAQRSSRDSSIEQSASSAQSSSAAQQGGVQLGHIKLSPDDRNWESQIPIGERSGIRLASSGSGLDQANGGPGSKDMDRARQSDDMARRKAERQRELAELGIGDYRSDPDNHPSEDDVGRLWVNNVNATVPRGEIVRTKKSVSTAYSVTARAQEDADPTRTHTRSGRDRVMELGVDDAKLSQKDFEQHMASSTGGSPSTAGGSMQLAGEHDFLQSAGGLFHKDSKLVLPRDSSSASSASSHTSGLSGMISSLKSKARSSGADAEDKLEQMKGALEDKYASARDGLEDALSDTKEKLGEWKDKAKSELEELGSKLKGAGESIKDESADKSRELKASAQSGMSKAKASASGWADRLESGAERVADKVKDGAEDVKEGAISIKDKAFHKLNEAMAHIKPSSASDIKQQPVRVEATPQYVHVERDNAERSLSSRSVDPIHTPDSLRGLGGGTPLPPPKLDLSLSKDASLTDAVTTKEGIYVPAGLRGLVDESDRQLPKASLPSLNLGSSSSSTLSSLSQAAAGARERMKQQGFYVPDSLRGLEDSEDLSALRSRGADPWRTPSPSSPLSVPRSALQELPHPNDDRGDVEIKHSDLKPRLDSIAHEAQQAGEGIVSKITHALHLDRSASPRERSSSPQMPLFDTPVATRSPSTDAVSYSNSDLSGRGRSPSPRPRSASPALSDQLAAANARDRSPTGTPHSGAPHSGLQDWDIMHDDQFEELLAEQME